MPAATQSSSKSRGWHATPWKDLLEASHILLQGPEEYLAYRTFDRLRGLLRVRHAALEVRRIDAAHYASGQLLLEMTPSLFEDKKLLEVSSLEIMNEAFLHDALRYLVQPRTHCTVVMYHRGGVRGKKFLDALKAASVPTVPCQPLKKDAEKAVFVQQEFALSGRKIDSAAVRALVTAVGSQLSELGNACRQLINDIEGVVDLEQVETYYGGRVESTAFKVADAAVAGNLPVAMASLRFALMTGVDPIPMVAALAMKMRAIARVLDVRGSSAKLAQDFGMPPWQIDQARRQAEHWTREGTTRAFNALSTADACSKGGGGDAVYALENAVLQIARSARRS